MKINIQTTEGKSFQFEVDKIKSVQDLKKLIQKEEGTPVNNQILIMGYKFIDNNIKLDEYLNEEQTILLTRTDRSLLLSSSIIFDNSTFIDRIHQCIIDLNKGQSKYDVTNILIEASAFLDINLDIETITELFSLILTCFSKFPQLCSTILGQFLEQSKLNSNRIIISASVLSFYVHYCPQIPIINYESFVSDSLQQIKTQVPKSNGNLEIFGFQIPSQFQLNFVIDIVSLTKLTEEIVLNLYPYIFGQKITSKTNIDFLISDIQKSGLFHVLPESIFTEDNLLLNLSPNSISIIIQNISEQTFRKIQQTIEIYIEERNDLTNSFSNSILNKCVECDILIKNIDKLISKLIPGDLKPNIWKYIDKNNILLSKKLALSIKDFPNSLVALKLAPQPEKLPQKVLEEGLLTSPDISIYDRVLASDQIECEVFKTSQFWYHIQSIVSDNFDSISHETIDRFIFYFQKFIKPNIFSDFFTDMVFHHYPPNQKESSFLVYLFKKLPSRYQDAYFYKRNIPLARAIEQQKSLPPVCLCQLFDFLSYQYQMNPESVSPYVLYLYEFSYKKCYSSYMTSLRVMPQDDKNDADLIDFIVKKGDLSLLPKMDEGKLSLIMCALLYTSNKDSTVVSGLTRETILPFIAICLNYLKFLKIKVLRSSDSIIKLLLEGCMFLSNNENPLLIASIDSILTNIHLLKNEKKFFQNALFQMIDILLHTLLSGEYKADKTLLLRTIIQLSCDNSNDFMQEKSLLLMNQYGIDLLKFFIDNFTQIDHEKLRENLLNLSLFDEFEMDILIMSNLSDPKSKDTLINTICFINNNCQYAPQINCRESIAKIIHAAIEEERWKDVVEIVKFMKYQRIEFTENLFKNSSIPANIYNEIFGNNSTILNDVWELISNILNDPKPELNKEIFLSLFKVLMEDEAIAMNYFATQFEKYTPHYDMEPYIIIGKLSIWIQKKYDIFLKSLHRCFVFNPENNRFCKKLNIEELPQSELGNSIISKLYEVNNYQSFVCLKNIASCFPFLFAGNTKHLFDCVLQAFENHLSVIYESENEEEKMISTKTVTAALIFLHSTLYSTKVIQAFVSFVFENIGAFSDYQFCVISHILKSLFETSNVKYVTFSLSLKYNFIENITHHLQRNHQKSSEFIYFYKISLYSLLNTYYKIVDDLYPRKNIFKKAIGLNYTPMYIDQIKSLEKPFENCFNNKILIKTTYNESPIVPTQFYINEYAECLMAKINEIQNFWITYDIGNNHTYVLRHDISQAAINQLISDFQKIKKKSPISFDKNLKIDLLPYPTTIKMVRYILSQPSWVSKWILDYSHISDLPEYYSVIQEVFKQLKLMEIPSKIRYSNAALNEDDLPYENNFDIEDSLFKLYCQKELFEIITKDMVSSNSTVLNNIINLIEILTKNDVALLSFLGFVQQYVDQNNSDLHSSFKSIKKFIEVLASISKNRAFKNNFIDVCGNKLIDTILSPKYRSNISQIADSFCLINCDFPRKVSHVIGFMFTSNRPEIIPHALNLLSKIGEEKLQNIMPVVNSSFLREIGKERVSYNNIICFLEHAPSVAKKQTDKLYMLVDSLIKKYQQSPHKMYFDTICSILNYLAPKRGESQNLIADNEIDFSNSMRLFSSSQDNQGLSVKKAPSSLKKSSPKFWNLYGKIRPFIDSLIKSDLSNIGKFNFLLEFHELVEFRIRASYFHSRMRKKINRKSCNYLAVQRQNILTDSFDKLQKLKTNDLMRKFSVKFEGEDGVDAGGLTKEWFTLIIQELFNPNYNLFKQMKSNSFQPSISSYLNGPQHLQYFNFAGKMMALALIEEQCVNAHLTTSFYRQILHQKPKLKDLEDYKVKLYDSLQWMLENDVDSLELPFAIDVKEFGEQKTVELIENGENILVTNENKREYISLYAQYYLQNSIKKQIDAFCSGFDEIIPPEEIKMFSASELDLLICGIPTIDIDDLKKNTVYELPYNENHPVMLLFFEVISKWDNESLAKFLQFLTGSSQVPIGGFKTFKDRGKPIKIMSGGNKERLPVAHTCFNLLALPGYDNGDDMNNKLIRAIQEREFAII
ncbi:hypothetical protein M9Y10_024262 [Tritrichomonas musculus]|uniref:HECT-type E3 ubiquitin transferase n=1 Tax=Tritrichomonas musculus TaxID=1915356 RepID=A0ABR2HDA9_9EUKA